MGIYNISNLLEKNKKEIAILYMLILILSGIYFALIPRLLIPHYIGDEVWYISASRNLLYASNIKITHSETVENMIKAYGFNIIYLGSESGINNIKIQLDKVAQDCHVVYIWKYSNIPGGYYLVPAPFVNKFLKDLKQIRGITIIPGYYYPDITYAGPTIFYYYNLEQPGLGKEIIMMSMIILGDNPWSWRIPSVIMFCIIAISTALIVYRVTRKYFHTVLAFTLVMIDPTLKIMGSIGMLDIYSAAFLTLGQYSWIVSHEYRLKKNIDKYLLYMLMTGTIVGLSSGVKLSGAFILPAIIFYIVYYSKNILECLRDLIIFGTGVFSGFILSNFPIMIIVSPKVWFGGLISSFKWHLSYKGYHPFNSPIWQWFYNKNPFIISYYPRIEVQTNWVILSIAIILIPIGIFYFKKYNQYYSGIMIPILTYISLISMFTVMYILGGKSQYSYYATILIPSAIMIVGIVLGNILEVWIYSIRTLNLMKKA